MHDTALGRLVNWLAVLVVLAAAWLGYRYLTLHG